MSDRPLPAPPPSPESAPFYAAAKDGKFLLRRCTECGKPHWYPRAVCPFCFGATEWQEASGEGVIYSYSPMRRTDPPYTIAYVTLAEGPTMMTNIVDCDPDALAIGQAVTLVWRAAANGDLVPCFRPAVVSRGGA